MPGGHLNHGSSKMTAAAFDEWPLEENTVVNGRLDLWQRGTRLIIGVGSPSGPSGISREMVGHQGCLADSATYKPQKASSGLLLGHPSLSREQKRETVARITVLLEERRLRESYPSRLPGLSGASLLMSTVLCYPCQISCREIWSIETPKMWLSFQSPPMLLLLSYVYSSVVTISFSWSPHGVPLTTQNSIST